MSNANHGVLLTFYWGILILLLTLSCSKTESSALAHCAPLVATAGTPMPAVVESPQRERAGRGVVTSG